MQLLVVTDNSEVAAAIGQAAPSALVQRGHPGHLNADLSVATAVAFTLKTIGEIPQLARALKTAITSLIVPKPEGEIEIVGPFGKVSMKFRNVSEESLQQALHACLSFPQSSAAGQTDGKK